MADDTLHAEVERLKAENAALKAQATRGISMKVSEKGGVDQAARPGRRHPRLHQGPRLRAQSQGASLSRAVDHSRRTIRAIDGTFA
jgi:hypothetical protein